jgi:hypothetical protein
MENLHKINQEYENNFINKNFEEQVNLKKYTVESFLLNHSTDELESLKDIIYEDKKKKLKTLFWMYEQEYKQNQRLKELQEYNQEFMKLPLNVKLNN